VTINRITAGAAALAIFVAGAGAAYLVTRGPRATGPAPAAGRPASVTSAPPEAGGIVHLPADLITRAGIAVEPASAASVVASVRVPGTVQPNAYRQVSVTPLVGGRVTRVLVELGQSVTKGAPIAEVYSPEAADARAQYLSAKADTDAGEARLRRTERLAALGSASQQELEQVRAEHVRHETEQRERTARLRLLGINPAGLEDAHADPASTVMVVAPQPGVVIQRPAIAGMTVEPSTVLATIVELSPVWIIADVFERDFARVMPGADATATAAAYPGTEWHGRVTYISPDVRPETRTAQVRIEVANPGAKLKFGMFVSAAIAARPVSGVAVPAAAIQTIGTDAVVFVPEPGTSNAYRERRVRLGPADADRVIVVDGLVAGESVVTKGSFELRAEAERQGVRPSVLQTAEVAITAAGFEPASISLQRGVPARVTFTRRTDQTCATEVVVPAYGVRRALPLNQPVTVSFVPAADGSVFQCGMGMLSGTIVVR
jgi:membrane fusion protein, heavy metal efflux system